MKLNDILPYLILALIVGGLIGYNEINDNALLEMLNNNNREELSETKQILEVPETEKQNPSSINEIINGSEQGAIIPAENKNVEFITELIESNATIAQKSYNCGAKGCFETAFKNCTPTIGIDEILEPYSQKTQYEIIGMGEKGCKVKTTFEISFFKDWEGKSITCELDNSLSITEAVGLIYQPNGSENLNCQGELLPEFNSVLNV